MWRGAHCTLIWGHRRVLAIEALQAETRFDLMFRSCGVGRQIKLRHAASTNARFGGPECYSDLNATMVPIRKTRATENSLFHVTTANTAQLPKASWALITLKWPQEFCSQRTNKVPFNLNR